jgi:hypothetical protein
MIAAVIVTIYLATSELFASALVTALIYAFPFFYFFQQRSLPCLQEAGNELSFWENGPLEFFS